MYRRTSLHAIFYAWGSGRPYSERFYENWPQKNSPTLQNLHRTFVPLQNVRGKFVQLQNVQGKYVQKFADEIDVKNCCSVQIHRGSCRKGADITGDQPISTTIERVNLT